MNKPVFSATYAPLLADDATVETSLPADLKEVRYVGYYTKGARSTFGPMKITRGE